MRRNRFTKIVATLGPASNTYDVIENLFLSGVDTFRLNFSHGTHEEHALHIHHIRCVEKKYDYPIGILADMQGPKLRIGCFANDSIRLEEGQTFLLDNDTENLGDITRVAFPHPTIFECLRMDDLLLLNDGRITLKITKTSEDAIETYVVHGGILSNRKGVNIPHRLLPIPSLTEKDHKDLTFALSQDVDWVALSFVQTPDDVKAAQELIQGKAKIASKLEKPLALEHLEDIIKLSDGIMVARGDLGVELPPEEVPRLQKQITQCCRRHGKPVIVATQMLESMTQHPLPTRAETSDVATAIYDGADAVMLSAESASGNYPLESVTMMQRIIENVEKDPYWRQMLHITSTQERRMQDNVPNIIALAAREVAKSFPIKLMITFTDSGRTTLHAARYRPEATVFALSPHNRTARYLTLVWGVYSSKCPPLEHFTHMTEIGLREAKKHKLVEKGDHVIITAGVPFGVAGGTNVLRIASVDEY
jgi:pyruvate kinase